MYLTYQLAAESVLNKIMHTVIDEISNYLFKSAKMCETNEPSLIKLKCAEFTVHLYSEQ